jgi:MFS family permease
VLALSILLVGTLGAAVAPSLSLMVASRALQGLGCAAVPTAVMGMLARSFPPGRRSQVMGAWGAANGIGQAIGPPLGGFVADAFGWRAIFGGLVPITLGVLVLTLRVVPRDSGHDTRMDWAGAGALTVGVALLMTAATAAPQPGVPSWLPTAGAALGIVILIGFGVTSLHRANPFIDPRLLGEMRWLRSASAVFVQQSSLAAVLVAVPLYLTGVTGLSTSATGLIVFALPLVWAVLAPVVGVLADRVGPRPVLRTGLGVLVAVDVGFAVLLGAGSHRLALVVAVLLVAGAGVALVQTPALTGATRSPAGQRGIGLGLFNMMRFVGAASGTAAVAAAWPDGLAWLFGGCATVAVGGLVLSFLGSELPDVSASKVPAPPAVSPG